MLEDLPTGHMKSATTLLKDTIMENINYEKILTDLDYLNNDCKLVLTTTINTL